MSSLFSSSNDRWSNNQPYRRYSKISDGTSSIVHESPHHRRSSSSSSRHSSINHQKSNVKPERDKHANTERIFDWLMQNSHSTITNLDEEILVKPANSSTTKKVLQTRIIPLDADPLFCHSDIRLKIDSSVNKQSLRSMSFLFPNFAKHLLKSSKSSMIINPKAFFKHTLNEDLSTDKELDERIKLLDQQIQISTSVLSLSIASTRPNSSLTGNDKSSVNSSDDSLIKSKLKPIPPPLSVISTIPKLANINLSPSLSTPPKFLTPTSARSSQYQSPSTTFSPIVKQKTVIQSPKPTTVLKSILKTSSKPSQSTTPNETRKAVHIISTKSSLESTIKKRVLPDTKIKIKTPQPLIDTSKPKPIPTVVKKVPVITKTPPPSKPLIKLPTIPKKSSSMPIKKLPPQKEIPKPKPVTNSSTNLVKKPIKFRQTSCMYDRIKARARSDQTRTRSAPPFLLSSIDPFENHFLGHPRTKIM